MKKITLIGFLLVALATSALAQEPIKTINIDFKDSRPNGVQLNLSLPLSFFETLRPQITEVLRSLEQEQEELDLRAIWQSIKDAGPNQYLEFHQGNEHVQVSTTGTHLVCLVDVQDQEDLEVTIPLALGDALVGSLGEFEYEAMIESLLSLGNQDLIKVTSPFINGRVWIE